MTKAQGFFRREDKPHGGSLLVLSLVATTLLSGLILASTTASADNDTTIDEVTITVPEACTLSGTGNTSHTATVSNGTYEDDIGTTTLKAYCNDPGGFAIYAIGYTGDSYTGTNHTKLVGTTNSSNTISTGTATGSNSSDPSNWAMKLSTTSGATYELQLDNGYGSYSLVPDTFTKVAHRDSGTDVGTNATGSTLTTTYATYISTTQPADTYVGKVLYTMVHPSSEEPLSPQPSTAGYINYYANASTAVGTMGRQSVSDGNTVRLFASNFSRTGYGFAGWSDAYDYATNANANFYGPNESITVPTGTTANGLSLYAVWVKSEGNLQDSSKTASVCNRLTAATYNDENDSDESTWSISASLNSISALTDTRDNQTYAIAKLTDGNCWMIENLRLDNTPELSSTNTNNPSLPLTNVYDTSTTSNHLSPTSSIAYIADTAPEGWCTTTSAACDDQSRIRTDNTSNRVTYTTTQTMSTSANLYSYGNYYNWYSVTAGNGTYSKYSGVADGDICPAGWHLPTGTGSGEFGLLSNSLGGYKNASNVAQNMSSITTPTSTIMDKRLRHFPNNLLYSGNVYGASLSNRGSSGYFWSSSAGGTGDAYYLYFYSSYVYPGRYNNNKYLGWAARCVVAPSS